MWHVKERKITMRSLLDDANLRSIDTYLARRRLRWIGHGHVRRMDWDRTPRKLLSSWCYQARPLGRPCLRWAESIEEDLRLARLHITKWHLKAENRPVIFSPCTQACQHQQFFLPRWAANNQRTAYVMSWLTSNAHSHSDAQHTHTDEQSTRTKARTP